MLEGPLRLISIVTSLIVLASFCAFAIGEARSGSESSQAGIAGQGRVATADPAGYAKPTPAQERRREVDRGAARELLDDADDVLMAPFAAVSDDSDGAWARRSFPALIGLVVYGFGLGFLSRYAAGRA